MVAKHSVFRDEARQRDEDHQHCAVCRDRDGTYLTETEPGEAMYGWLCGSHGSQRSPVSGCWPVTPNRETPRALALATLFRLEIIGGLRLPPLI